MNTGLTSDKWRWASLALVVLLTIAAHVRGLHGQFLEWDDTTHITQNPAIRTLALENVRTMFTDYTAKLYLPLTWLSFAIDYQIWGRDPFGYHLTNLVLHVVNTVLVFMLVYRFVAANPIRSGDAGRENVSRLQIAFLTAAIFGGHPLRVESVAWITERKDVLFACFYFLALAAYLEWSTSRKRWTYLACFILFVASALSKSTAVTFPLVILLLDFFWKRRVAWLEKIPFLAVSAIITAVTVTAQASGSGETVVPPELIPLWARAGLVGYCALFYVRKFFWPFHLSALYPTFEEMEWQPIFAVGWLLVLITSLVGVYALRRRAPLLLPAWLFYLITLSPTIGLMPVGVHVVADRFSYVPLLGLALPVSVAIVGLVRRVRARALAIGAGAVLGVVLIGLGFRTAQRTAVWANTEALFQNALLENPNCYPALVNLTVWYTGMKRLDDAITYGRRAVEVAPNGLVGRKNLARALMGAGRYGDAIAALRPAIEHGIDDPAVWRALYECFTALGDEPNAQAAKKKWDRFVTAPSKTQSP